MVFKSIPCEGVLERKCALSLSVSSLAMFVTVYHIFAGVSVVEANISYIERDSLAWRSVQWPLLTSHDTWAGQISQLSIAYDIVRSHTQAVSGAFFLLCVNAQSVRAKSFDFRYSCVNTNVSVSINCKFHMDQDIYMFDSRVNLRLCYKLLIS